MRVIISDVLRLYFMMLFPYGNIICISHAIPWNCTRVWYHVNNMPLHGEKKKLYVRISHLQNETTCPICENKLCEKSQVEIKKKKNTHTQYIEHPVHVKKCLISMFSSYNYLVSCFWKLLNSSLISTIPYSMVHV